MLYAAVAFNLDQDEMIHAIINNDNKELNAVRRALRLYNWRPKSLAKLKLIMIC